MTQEQLETNAANSYAKHPLDSMMAASYTPSLHQASKLAFVAGINWQKEQPKKECLHYWVDGYIAESIIYCNKCQRELADVYGATTYRTHTCKNGLLITIQENNLI